MTHRPDWPPGPRRLAPGSPVLLRSVFDDHVGAVIPNVVVVDNNDHVALYQPPGTTMLIRTGRRGGPNGRNMYPGGWDGGHAEVPWLGAGVVRVHRWGEPWSVWRWLDDNGWRAGCYVNLERAWVVSPVGFDTADWILDLVVDAAGVPHWKDADELEWAVDVGAVSHGHAVLIREAGALALAAVRDGAWPLSADWDDWIPDRRISGPVLTGQLRMQALRLDSF